MDGQRWEGKEEVVLHTKEWLKCTNLHWSQRESSRELAQVM